MQSFALPNAAPDLALVHLELPGNESLYPRLLAAAVQRAGYRPRLYPVQQHRRGPEAVRAAVADGAPVLAFELTYPSSSLYEMSLAALARKWGYRGTVVCYGTHATLAADWVLDRTPAVDCVLRQDPAHSMPTLLAALQAGASLDAVPGLTNREQVTPLSAAVPDTQWRPLRGERPTILGVPMAEMIGSKGCFHRCDYCNHSAKQDHAVRERRVLPTVSPAHSARKARPLSDLCDEMAELYHGQSVRYFHFVDPLPVPPREKQALEWARDFRASLRARGVEDASLGFNTRGDGLSAELVDALVELGLRRTLCGVESTTEGGLANLGRVRHAGDAEGGLRRLVERGVVVVFNNLMLHPDATLDSIRAELAGLRQVRGALFDTIKLRLFPGTQTHRDWISSNRTVGGELLSDFTFEDPRVARFSRLCDQLRAHYLGTVDPTCQLNDLWFSAVLARRHATGTRPSARTERALASLVDALNGTRLDALDGLLHAAEHGLDAQLGLRRAGQRIRHLVGRMDALAEQLHGDDPARTYRNLAATASLVFVLAHGSGCAESHEVGASGPGLGPGFVPPDATTAPLDSGADSTDATLDATRPDAVGTPGPAIGPSPDVPVPDAAVGPTPEEVYWEAREELESLVRDNCDFYGQYGDVVIALDDKGGVEGVTVHGMQRAADGGLTEDDRALMECLAEVLEDEVFPPLAGEEVAISPVIILL